MVSFLVFSLMELAPGTAIDAILAYAEGMTPEQREELIRMHNLDRSMLYRYGIYMLNLVQGDLGVGDITRTPVWDVFIERLPNTLILAFSALIIGVSISIPLGIIAARRAGTLIDNSVTVFSLVGMSMPAFWVGLLMLLLFSFHLNWLPSGTFDDGIRSLILPAICSSFTLMANSARQTRSNMLEVLKSDYLRTARAKGVPEKAVIRKHALGNAWIPIITAVGSSLSTQLAGAVVVEQVFTWPGIGRMAAEAVMARDVTTVTGVVIMTTILYVLVQLIVDILYAFVDPRIKAQYQNYGKRKKSKGPRAADAAPRVAIFLTEEERTAALNAIEAEPVSSDEPEPVVVQAVAQGKSYATRTTESITADRYKDVGSPSTDDSGMLATQKYAKRNRMGEIFHSLRKNKGAMAGFIILGLTVIAFIGSLFISWESITVMNAGARFAPPSLQHPFGADNFGRDLFLRVIYGTRFTLAIGLGSVGFAAIFGITAGCFAGFYGGRADDIILRFSDVLASIPGMLLGMVVVTVLGQSLQNLIIAVGIQAIPIYLRMTRASIMTVRNHEFVEAAHAIGISKISIIFKQVLPNGLAPIIVTLTASLGISITVGAALSFLGFGVPVPQPEWGALIADSREFARLAPWLMSFPGLFIMVTVLAFNLLGDGLRDALDPKLKTR